jgi:signal-transduction protein with cAMP-binding, CBS, and nucleotidyltransferase domain
MRIALMGRVVGLGASRAALRFESIRERSAPVPASLEQRPAGERLRAAVLECRRGELPRPVASCVGCPRFVNWLPGPGCIQVRCLYCDSDPVTAVMTLAAGFVTVLPQTAVADARLSARDAAVDHVLVVRSHHLVGVVSRDRLAAAAATDAVAAHMSRRAWTVPADTTVAAAAALMCAEATSLLLVVDDDTVVGLLTRADLRRIGAAELVAADGSVPGR